MLLRFLLTSTLKRHQPQSLPNQTRKLKRSRLLSKKQIPQPPTSRKRLQPSHPQRLRSKKTSINIFLNTFGQPRHRQSRFLRFFSIRHLAESGVTPQRLANHRAALAKAINHLSRESVLVVPKPIDSVAGGTIFVVDIRKLGWHRTAATDQADSDFKINTFDLLLLEYPYGILPEDSPAFDQLKTEFLSLAHQVRPIPFMRADWFCSVALQPPLYHDLLQIPRTLEELESDLRVDVQSNLDSGIARRAGMTVSGVSRNNRAVERHPYRDGYYWKSHDFANNMDAENILMDPMNFVPGGGEMIFSLPNGLNAYFVTNARGTRIDAAPTEIVVDKFASDRTVRNGLGCIRCHNRGIKNFRDVVRPIVEQLPGSPGFDKRKTLEIYPPLEEWEQLIKQDQTAFLNASSKLGIDGSGREPLSIVTTDFLENPLSAKEAASELGTSEDNLIAMARSRGLMRLGLAPLAAGSIIRRDGFENSFDEAVRALGLGIPVIPIDGNLRTQYSVTSRDDKIGFRTNKPNNFFEPGDRMRIFVDNRTSDPMTIELYGTSIVGEKVCLTDGQVSLDPGKTFTFPNKSEPGIEIRGGIGEETITLFATSGSLPTGRVLTGKNMDDRVVHAFYEAAEHGHEFLNDPTEVIKKTIAIETR